MAISPNPVVLKLSYTTNSSNLKIGQTGHNQIPEPELDFSKEKYRLLVKVCCFLSTLRAVAIADYDLPPSFAR